MSAVVLLGLRILAAIALYSFVGWALYQLWRSLQQEAALLYSRKITPINLTINTPDQTGRSLELSQSDIVIGRDPDCECVLEDGTISARHARLAYHHNQWWLDDLQSTNGTKLNDEPVQTSTVVVNGDTIKCGQTTLVVRL
jgi:pSer/pThr/pTyr-binding forkhead associated (FHA) protein